MPKICLFSDHHLSYNPRLWKEAFFWEKQGWEVVIVNMWTSATSRNRDKEILQGHNIKLVCYLNMIPGEIGSLKFNFFRLRKRIACELVKWFKIDLPVSISYAPQKMYTCVLNQNADVYSAHLECSFWAGRKLRKAGRQVFFDFEDWYSRDYLMPDRPVRLLKRLEHFALHHGVFTLTTSAAMANALQTTYNAPRAPEVIYNGFAIVEEERDTPAVQSTENSGQLRLIWFSRTIGENRGVEKLISVINQMHTPLELHLLGECTDNYRQKIEALFVTTNTRKLVFHDFIPHEKLHTFISEFDIGLAVEQQVNDSRNLTITNKMLQYLQAGIKVIASDTEGQKEVAAYFPKAVKIVENGDPASWPAAILDIYHASPINLAEHQSCFNAIFSMNKQEEKLATIAQKYFNEKNRTATHSAHSTVAS